MKLHLDAEADALFLILREGTWHSTREVAPGINLELGADDEVMAIEVLGLAERGGRPILEHLELDFAPAIEKETFEVDLPPEVEAWLKHQQKAMKAKSKT